MPGRPIWSGAISFGLVTVPIKLEAATESRSFSLRQIHLEDGGRIRYGKVCELAGQEHTPARVVVHARDGHIRTAYAYGDAPAASPDNRGRKAGGGGLFQDPPEDLATASGTVANCSSAWRGARARRLSHRGVFQDRTLIGDVLNDDPGHPW
ncbi:Ku protein [Streptomyces sp. NBC_01003]|uniref:Ku protein n=1 Tax=Streptomyces sp. NBC_01003 TaxID=2903714 RepID=UPI00386F6474